MSLLLDALNKADEERKRNENPPSIGSNHDTSLVTGVSGNKIPVFTIAASIGVVLAILFVVVYWLGRHTLVINATNETAPTTSSTAITNTPITANAVNPTNSNTQTTNSPHTTAHANEVNNAATTNYNNAAQTKPRNAGDTPSEESVANLYQQNATNVAPVTQPTKTIATAPTTRTEVNTQPVKTEPSKPETISSIKQFSNLPELRDLPNNVLERIPSLNYTEHHYNSNGGNVVINGSVKHVNDQLAYGLVIDKILEDGMVLHIDTYSFKMRALNSWVNM